MNFASSHFSTGSATTGPAWRKIFAAIYAIAVLFCAAAPQILRGQDTGPTLPELETGEPASSYALGGIDSVNYYTGGLNVHVPVATIGARGTFSKTLVTPIQRQWLTSGGGAFNYPYSSNVPNTLAGYGYIPGYLTIESSSQHSLVCSGGPYDGYWAPSALGDGNVVTWMVWHAPDLTETVLVDTAYGGQAEPVTSDCSTFYVGTDRGKVFRSYDGSGMTYVGNADVTDGPPSGGITGLPGTLYFKDGTRYTLNASGVATMAEDRNGNQSKWNFSSLFYGGEYTVLDSAGRNTFFSFTEDLNTVTYDTIQWTGTGGVQRQVTVNYTPLGGQGTVYPLGTSAIVPQAVNCLFSDLAGSSSNVFNPWVVSSIVLPDLTAYTFTYNVYGEVAKITLPTGGSYTVSVRRNPLEGTGGRC